MAKCKWSLNSLCQTMVIKDTVTKVTCDGIHSKCQGQVGNIEDIRDRDTKPSWGGRRRNAGAPLFNLNRLKDGQQSKLLKRGIERMADDPEMRAVLLIIARLATSAEVPRQTKLAITAAMKKGGVKYEKD